MGESDNAGGSRAGGAQGSRIEIHVPSSETSDLTILSRSDIFFAVLYGLLFLWGLVLTLLAI